MIVKAERTGEAPESVEVIGQYVWLRKNIQSSTREVDLDEFGAIAATVYSYDEVHYTDSTSPNAEQVRESFEELWSAHASDGMPDAQRIDNLTKQLETTKAELENANAALLELGDLIGGE